MQNDYPNIEFSYETITNKKISTSYDVCLAIPQAKKYVVWFSNCGEKNVCRLMEMNRYKKISISSLITTSNTMSNIYLGTILFGSINNDNSNNNFFVIEDILTFQGVSLRNIVFGIKLGLIEQFLKTQGLSSFNKPEEPFIKTGLSFFLPVFWKSHLNEEINLVPSKIISYPLHHIQYRSLKAIVPYLNVFLNNRGIFPWDEENNNQIKSNYYDTKQRSNSYPIRTNYSNNNYMNHGKCTFIVIADTQNDIYHLFASSLDKAAIYYDIAYIPNYKNSVYMNSLFRNIKENSNLDNIEESDDEDDFEDVRENKYVDLELKLFMDCVYHKKFKKWVPIKVVDNDNENMNLIIGIENLPKLFTRV